MPHVVLLLTTSTADAIPEAIQSCLDIDMERTWRWGYDTLTVSSVSVGIGYAVPEMVGKRVVEDLSQGTVQKRQAGWR